jgi:hypothetical protein
MRTKGAKVGRFAIDFELAYFGDVNWRRAYL